MDHWENKIGARQRKGSIRLKGWDYDAVGAYMVTLCTYNRRPYFGDVLNGRVHLNPIGLMVAKTWLQMPIYNSAIKIDGFAVMPDHFHAIAWINPDQPIYPDKPFRNIQHGMTRLGEDNASAVGAAHRGRPAKDREFRNIQMGMVHFRGDNASAVGAAHRGRPPHEKLSDLIGKFKTMVCARYREGVIQHGWPEYSSKLWQRSFHDRIIRNERELIVRRRYIFQNPDNP